MSKGTGDWLRSAEVCRALRISTCDLAHLREDVAIRAEKRGNAYWYSAKDVLALQETKLISEARSCGLDDADKDK